MVQLTSRHALLASLALSAVVTLTGCPDPDDPAPDEARSWSLVATDLPAALLAVGGVAEDDVWAVGADKGAGPLVLHFDGAAWTQVQTGFRGSLWWVHPFSRRSAVFAGANANVLLWRDGVFTRVTPPGIAHHTVFGIWGRSETDFYVVGSVASKNGFIWHYDGATLSEVPLPSDIPTDKGDIPGIFKVWGDGEGRVWVVGGKGLVLRKEGVGPFEHVPTDTDATLFTVAGVDGRCVVVGGGAQAVLLEESGGRLEHKDPANLQLLQGVAFNDAGAGYATGQSGAIYERKGGAWEAVSTGLSIRAQSLHAVWVGPKGSVWAVGGNVLGAGLDGGVLVHLGSAAVPTPEIQATTPAVTTCPADGVDLAPGKSIARRWNEQILNAVRRDIPRPGVHARNLYHLAAAMWDAWAAYDDVADGVFVDDKRAAGDVEAARAEAISYAAYRVLMHRYQPSLAVGGAQSEDCFTKFMEKLGYDPTNEATTGDSPAALGNLIGETIIAATADDGANEADNYKDTTGWTSVNPPLVVEGSAITVVDPSVWQPLILAESETQNGIPTGAGVQGYIGSNWNLVTPFAMTREHPEDLFHDPGPFPAFDDAEMNDWAVEMVVKESKMDPRFDEMIDISPGAFGNNSLGANDGHGHTVNPVTGQPYAPNLVKLSDFSRVLAEFWADGPKSETPPGHWNTLANAVADSAGLARRIGGEGPELGALEWDVKMYLALDGAVHDAAITAWGVKRVSQGPRPITIVRYKASLGQSSNPSLPHYHADGLPLVPGVIELVTAQSSAPGQRHERLARYVGEIAVLGWRGEPGDRASEVGGVDWVRGVEWLPYQRRTFVTPAFPGFVSGHSTFSRAGAEVLTQMTGSAYFPGGLGEFTAPEGSYLVFEDGPSETVVLQWGTYYDASDQAGQSRLWGGIHLQPDDFIGRTLGSMVGADAVAKARTYFDGTARD
ncbi:MAG: vanadium-dependent haloperoxidase [Myxococcales bacterium]|nr:vanadium-dependent haloperoxidase [Myxococcales bacterium]